ncbi:MAG: LPS assembly protein LptD [Geobacteraceae bacterium]|nr:LPS assembly protein LptD [Geobacteraceae bacterium]
MRQLITKILPVALFLASSLPLAVSGAELPGAGEVKVKADAISYDREKDTLQADGNVEIRWGQFTLDSDTALVRQGENEAVAEGKVKLRKDGDILTSDRIRINYLTEQGEVENGALFVKQWNFHLRGARFLKTGAEQYRLERGTFTTCDGPEPSWRFSASDLDVSVEDYARGRNAVFYVKDIPVFYTPYLVFPVKRERQSGFLFPRIGNSTKKGFSLDVPFYWAISPSQDLTFDLDFQTKRGAGLGVDYRFLRPRESGGEYKGYLIYDTDQEKGRGYLMLKGQEFLSSSLSLTTDVNLTIDRDFFRDFGEASGDYNRQLLDSTAFLTKNLGGSSFTGEARYVDNLDAPSNRVTLQKLPTLTFTRARSPIGGTPVYFGLDSSFTNFYRDDGIRGQRLDLHPTLAFYHAIPNGIDFSVWGGYRQRLYNGYGAETGDGYRDAGLFDGGATVSTSLARVYGIDRGELRAVRHTIIPELSYQVVQQKDQERLPFFNFDDRVVGGEMVTWSLSNFVTGKQVDPAGASLYRDLLYLRLSQGYQASGSRRELLTLVDEGRRFTDIRLEASYSPAKNFSIATDSRYNPNRTRFSTASLGLDLNDGGGNLAALSYRFARGEVQYLEGKAALSLVKPFVFNYTGRYSFDKGGFLESFVSAEYKRQCWSVTLSYRDRPDNREFLVSFTLAGVGAIGPVKAL